MAEVASAPAVAARPESEAVEISDGTSITMARVPGVDDEEWEQVKAFLAENPEKARQLQAFAKDPEAVRGWMQTQAIAQHYEAKLQADDEETQSRLKGLAEDSELEAVFDDIKQNGMEAIMKYYNNEELMLKISRKMGGLPEELRPVMSKIDSNPLTFHEAAREGDLKRVQECLGRSQAIDAQDQKGITALGYAIGANRIAVVKKLLDSRANPHAVDSQGNNGVHYAAGYGRKELLEYLLRLGVNVNQANANGQTPLVLATGNRQAATVNILRQHNGQVLS